VCGCVELQGVKHHPFLEEAPPLCVVLTSSLTPHAPSHCQAALHVYVAPNCAYYVVATSMTSQ
jgi:hypothetical protein